MLTNYLHNADNIFCFLVLRLSYPQRKKYQYKSCNDFAVLLIVQFVLFYEERIRRWRQNHGDQLSRGTPTPLIQSSLVGIKGLRRALGTKQFYLTYPREALALLKYLFRYVLKFRYTVTLVGLVAVISSASSSNFGGCNCDCCALNLARNWSRSPTG